MKILILGVNGFIGNALVRRILATRDWEVFGMDLHSNKITEVLGNPRFHYLEGDIAINKEWIEYHIKKCDVALPLVAIATPMTYVKKPLEVFELDFEENLRRANFRHDVNGLVLTDRREREIPNVGIIELEDPETGRRIIMDTGSKKIRKKFKEMAQQHRENLDGIFTRCHVDYTDLDTAQSYVDAIVAFFKRRQGRKW